MALHKKSHEQGKNHENLFNFIERYGKKSFVEMPFTEVDNIILSCIMYANFSGIIPNHGTIKLSEAAQNYLNIHDKKKVEKLGIAMRNAYRILELAISQPRYSNIDLQHFRYIIDSDTQFAAMTFKLDDGNKFIGFEGTDQMISGWKEDFYMPFKFPVDAHRYAIRYINENISLFDKSVYVGGHSKGGNLAIVASMFARAPLRHKIKIIYSNDGPGLRKQEFQSRQFARVRDRIIHIIPDCSLVGVALFNKEHYVIHSTKKNLFCHDATTWTVEDDHFLPATQSEKSKSIEQHLRNCFEKIPDATKEKIIRAAFETTQKLGYSTTLDLFKIHAIFRMLKELRGISPETRRLVSDTIQVIAHEFRQK